MANSIFKLVGSIFVENNEANKNLEDTGKKADGLGGKLSSAVGTAAKFGAGIATAAGGAAAALMGVANSASESLDAIQKGAQKTGMSYENYQKLAYACDRSGASIDNLSKGMKNITKDLAAVQNGNNEAAETYKKLGISVKNADGSLKTSEQIMNESLMALADMTDETERNALAQEVLGNGYTELIPLLNSGSEGIQEMMQSASDLGLVMSDEAVDAGAAFGDAMADMKDSIGGIMTSIGAELMPMITEAVGWVKEHMPEIKAVLQNVFQFMQGFVQNVMAAVKNLWAYIEPYIPIVIEAVKNLLGNLLNFWNNTLKPMFDSIIGFVRDVVWPALKVIIDAVSPYIKGAIETISNIFNNVLKPIFTGLIDFITGVFSGDWKKAWDGVVGIFKGIWNGIVEIFKFPINVLIDGINSFFHALNHVEIPDWVPVVGGMGFHLDDIPHLAKGGVVSIGGHALVGEDGAEVIDLPAGARVTPLNDNNNAFAGMNARLDALLEVVQALVARDERMGVYINGEALVGEIAPAMDNTLGSLMMRAGRGV